MDRWRSLRESIPALQDQIYLNTGVSGPPPAAVLDEERRWAERLGRLGPGRPDVLAEADAELERVRQAIAGLLGAGPDEVALTRSCSEGLAIVAAGLPWQPGDEVIVSDLEHISGLLPWYQLARERGVIVRRLSRTRGMITADEVAGAVSPRTRLICMSHVAYNTGAVLPVADVAEIARKRKIWLLVDGAQGPGQMPVNVRELGCHFYACAGQKWLLGPDGTGALFVDREVLENVAVTRISWAAVARESEPAERFRLHETARRFEVAGYHVPSLAALGRAVTLWHELGPDRAQDRIRELVGRLREGLARIPGVEIIGPDDETRRSGLVVFRLPGVDAERAVRLLWERHRIVCRWLPDPKAVRASVHAFTDEADVDRLALAAAELVHEEH
ncbi:MAG: aminotransferase class V-fold PLP-dependent enzyme [Firmicutes bacterium]|nr:aminotransferase class V-fold PLP-dependent enzyme [Bacillota bacterium]